MFDKETIYNNIKQAWTEELQQTTDLPTDIARTFKAWVQGLIAQASQQQAAMDQQQSAAPQQEQQGA